MKVKMIASITGTRNGQDWPAAGETVDLPDAEARDLVAGGLAVELDKKAAPAVETAAVVAPETAAEPKPRARKAPTAKKG
jgi:hypothetical protein